MKIFSGEKIVNFLQDFEFFPTKSYRNRQHIAICLKSEIFTIFDPRKIAIFCPEKSWIFCSIFEIIFANFWKLFLRVFRVFIRKIDFKIFKNVSKIGSKIREKIDDFWGQKSRFFAPKNRKNFCKFFGVKIVIFCP